MTDKLSEVARAIRKKCAEIEHRPEYAPEAMVPDMMWFADEYATAAIEAHEKALEAEGLVIVPREPTGAMVKRGMDKQFSSLLDTAESDNEVASDTWKAMVDAALEASHG